MRFKKTAPIFLLAGLITVSICCTREQPVSKDVFQFVGRIKWNPGNFPPMPEWAPLDLSMHLNENILSGKKVLDMQLLLHNPTQDTVFLTAGAGSTLHFDFIVTMLDSTRIWNRLQSNGRAMAQATITLEPGETRRFQHTWDYTDYDGNHIEEGKYLIYGGIEFLSLSDRLFNERRDIGKRGIGEGVGVGPDTLFVK